MGKTLSFLFFFCCLFITASSFSQSVQVSEPKLELRDNTIHITYDILSSTPSDEFTVDLIVTDGNGNRIHSAALKGDIGEMVSGGNNKQIEWDLSVDKIEMNANIYVKVYVKAIPPPAPIIVPVVTESPEPSNDVESSIKEDIEGTPGHGDKEESSVQAETKQAEPEPIEVVQKEENEMQENHSIGKSSKPVNHKSFNRTGIFFQSLVFPGLGLSRVTGKPHWLRGVAGYGCIAGAVVMNKKAIATYNGIPGLSDYEDKNETFKDAMSQDQTSEILAYTAIAIWVSDMIWTLVGTSNLKKTSTSNKVIGIGLHSSIDPVSSTPMVGLTYRF